MSEEQEPSIEEILASIRQIISDDDEEGATESAPAPAPEAEPKPEPAPEPEQEEEEEDSVLELTKKVDEDSDPESEFEPEPERMQIDLRDSEEDDFDLDLDEGDSIFTETAESAAAAGFAKLASRASLDRRGTGDTTIEDIVRELMKPMLREWLDIHLPPLIEKVVKKELQKIARRTADED